MADKKSVDTKVAHSDLYKAVSIAYVGWGSLSKDELNTFVKANLITKDEYQQILDDAAVPFF